MRSRRTDNNNSREDADGGYELAGEDRLNQRPRALGAFALSSSVLRTFGPATLQRAAALPSRGRSFRGGGQDWFPTCLLRTARSSIWGTVASIWRNRMAPDTVW